MLENIIYVRIDHWGDMGHTTYNLLDTYITHYKNYLPNPIKFLNFLKMKAVTHITMQLVFTFPLIMEKLYLG